MSINATTTSVSNTASSSQVSGGVNSDMSQKTSAESSFKDEMEKVTQALNNNTTALIKIEELLKNRGERNGSSWHARERL